MLENKWSPFDISGRIVRISGFLIEAVGLNAKIGSLCQVGNDILAEVIGFKNDITFLMTSDELNGISPGTRILQLNSFPKMPVGEGLLGRIIDAQGKVLDNLGALQNVEYVVPEFTPINPLTRAVIKIPLDVGVKAINGLLTIGQGQRIGLFAGSGVGKSILLGMITKYSNADVVVVSLVGERGREVKEFIEDNVGKDALHKTIIVASPADTSPLLRIKAAENATFIAEYFKSKKKRVLLLMDSVTRYAHALREFALAQGEPPTARGYPASVFAKIPKLLERAGNGETQESSITGIYTVLVDGDDMQDPIADCARGVLDGHIVLSRALAEEGHYPAIDIEQSISRTMDKVSDSTHLGLARLFKKCYAKYRNNKDFISMGAYQKGIDAEMDSILEKKNLFFKYLQQLSHEKHPLEECKNMLNEFSCFEAFNANIKSSNSA